MEEELAFCFSATLKTFFSSTPSSLLRLSHHVAHIFAGGHGGDAVKRVFHGGDLFEDFGLGGGGERG